jgi:hypothetical protein
VNLTSGNEQLAFNARWIERALLDVEFGPESFRGMCLASHAAERRLHLIFAKA